MDLNDLLADVEGVGEDYFVHSAPPPASRVKPPIAGTMRSVKGLDDIAPVTAPASAPTPPASVVAAPAEATAPSGREPVGKLDLVIDIEMELTVELGRLLLPLKDLLRVQPQDRFILQQSASTPLDIYVNHQLIARGEALIVDGNLAVKIVELHPLTAV